MNVSLCEDADSVVAIDHHDFGVAIRIYGVVGETNLVAFPSGIDHEIYMKIKRD